MKKFHKIALMIGLASLVLASTSVQLLPQLDIPDFTEHELYTVTRIVDGDTIIVNGDIRVRLIGVDTPETVHPQKPVEYYSKEASLFVTNLLKGEQVYLVGDEGTLQKDRYGRKLAYVYRFPDGLFVNAEIIRQGYGHAYIQYPFQYMEEFMQLERFARQADKGLWAKQAEDIAESQENSKTVYITQTGTRYHRESCPHLRHSKIPIDLQQAQNRDLSTCGTCFRE